MEVLLVGLGALRPLPEMTATRNHEVDASRLVDTSCGDGAFVVAALRRLLLSEPGASIECVLERLEAWEIHFHAAGESRARVTEVLEQHGWTRTEAREASSRMVREGDFLTECDDSKRYGTIIGNPPYLRWMYVPEVLRNEYEEALPGYATQDMLHAFLDRCTARLAEGGEIAFVTSDRWLANENASKLREAIGQRMGVAKLQRLDCATAFYRPKLRRKGSPPRVHPVAVVLRDKSECAVMLGREAIFEGAQDDGQVIRTLGDVASVRLAPWLGTNGVFVVDAETAKKLPPSALVPAMDTDDVRDGALKGTTRFAILTKPGEEPAEAVREHLLKEMPRMCTRGRRSDWLPPERFDRLDLSREQLVVPRISRTLRPIRVPAGVLPINHNLSLVAQGVMSLSELEERLMSPASQKWMEARAARLENGYFSITTRLLRQLPMD